MVVRKFSAGKEWFFMRLLQGMMILALTAIVSVTSCGDSFRVRPFEPLVDGKPVYNAVCYGPHRDGQRPYEVQPSAGELLEDLHLMLPHWKLIRIYGAAGFAERFLKVIRENGFDVKVILGVWIDPEERRDESGEVLERFGEAAEKNLREVEAGIRLANEYPDIVAAVSVGNETMIYWSAHVNYVDIVIGHVRRVRNGVKVPVTVADDYNYWNKPESRELSSEIDFILLHGHPMWNGLQLEDALDWQRDQLRIVQDMHPDRLVVIGETGWATSKINEGEQGKLIKGRPGEEEQRIFYDAISAWAVEERQTVFFFEAFDENWKGGTDPAEVEKHWGLFRADRSPKSAMSSGAGR
jgi:exo-beta-1,3-glucanase (GH17 family)